MLVIKNPPANAGGIRYLGVEDPLEENKATQSSILAWRIPWTEEPGESHGQRSLAGYGPQGRIESDTTEVT